LQERAVLICLQQGGADYRCRSHTVSRRDSTNDSSTETIVVRCEGQSRAFQVFEFTGMDPRSLSSNPGLNTPLGAVISRFSSRRDAQAIVVSDTAEIRGARLIAKRYERAQTRIVRSSNCYPMSN
jgi:hypothetical protein